MQCMVILKPEGGKTAETLPDALLEPTLTPGMTLIYHLMRLSISTHERKPF